MLEHVDDRKALTELHRILTPGGKLIVMVPIVEGWENTHEDSSVSTEHGRYLHFAQKDHLRLYGRNFVDLLRQSGFSVTSYSGTPAECAEYGLSRGEKVFVGTKS